jgi:predicted alpha/beta-fold hydrolase
MTQALQQSGYQTCFMHFRGCSGKPNKLNRSYHSGETEDLSSVIAHAEKSSGKPVYAAIGYSLGGNVLLKWLGEQGEQSKIQHAVAVSVPYILSDAAKRMNQGVSKNYQNYLLTKLRQSYQQKYQHRASPLNVDIDQLKDFASFDDQVTAPLHGFKDSEEYYRLSSSRQYLKHITTPTLLIHSKDDPFMFTTTIPNENDLSPSITLEVANSGGHVGFISGTIKPQRWLEQRIIKFIQ